MNITTYNTMASERCLKEMYVILVFATLHVHVLISFHKHFMSCLLIHIRYEEQTTPL